MKPSEIKSLTAKKAWMLPDTFAALTWKGVVYCNDIKDVEAINSSKEIDSTLKAHETIHIKQAASMDDSWRKFYWRYICEWIKNLPLIFIHKLAPYKFMPIELEAYKNERDFAYAKQEKVEEWRKFEKLTLKEKWKIAKEYFEMFPRPNFCKFLNKKFNE